jgi:hypothetical protein
MNRNFEHQHLGYIVIRPWLVPLALEMTADIPDATNPYTAHLLEENVRQGTVEVRRKLTNDNFSTMTIPPSPTKADLNEFIDMALDGFPGVETDMTARDVCAVALNSVGFFPNRLWDDTSRLALDKLRRRATELGPSEYFRGGAVDAFVVSKALEEGNVLDLVERIVALEPSASEFFAAHPFVPIETLEACDRLPLLFVIARCNPNAGPMLERIIKSEESDDDYCLDALRGPNAITYDYEKIKQAGGWVQRELTEYLHRPVFVRAWLDRTGKSPEEFDPLSTYAYPRPCSLSPSERAWIAQTGMDLTKYDPSCFVPPPCRPLRWTQPALATNRNTRKRKRASESKTDSSM